MEQRTGLQPVNADRGLALGRALVERYQRYDNSIQEINVQARGQMQILLTDMMLTLTPLDFEQAGFRMGVTEQNTVCDMTKIADMVGGQFVFQEWMAPNDYAFIGAVLRSIRDKFEEISSEDCPIVTKDEVWDKIQLPE